MSAVLDVSSRADWLCEKAGAEARHRAVGHRLSRGDARACGHPALPPGSSIDDPPRAHVTSTAELLQETYGALQQTDRSNTTGVPHTRTAASTPPPAAAAQRNSSLTLILPSILTLVLFLLPLGPPTAPPPTRAPAPGGPADRASPAGSKGGSAGRAAVLEGGGRGGGSADVERAKAGTEVQEEVGGSCAGTTTSRGGAAAAGTGAGAAVRGAASAGAGAGVGASAPSASAICGRDTRDRAAVGGADDAPRPRAWAGAAEEADEGTARYELSSSSSVAMRVWAVES